MTLRLRHLEAADPRSSPLPHGTEVVTRTDRDHDGRRIPSGSVGRVARVEGERVDVRLVGLGVVTFARDELTPRRHGQALFAVRRAEAWEALEPCVVLTATVGSRAWGLADDASDHDVRGVFAVPFRWSSGLVEAPHDLVSADGSATHWSVDKAIRQGLRADPNTLEMLFVESAEARDPIGAWLLEERDAFVSKEIFGTFGRYALGQLRRLGRSQRLADHRARVLEWLREDPTPSLDVVAERLVAAAGVEASGGRDALVTAKEYVKHVYRSLADQGLLPAADFAALATFARTQSADFELPRELRPKNAYNLLRLIATATGWLRDGAPRFVVEGPLRARLLEIKGGAVALDDVIAEGEIMASALEAARDASPLSERPQLDRADALLRRITEEIARRAIEGAPGPLGRDAPPPPEVTWA